MQPCAEPVAVAQVEGVAPIFQVSVETGQYLQPLGDTHGYLDMVGQEVTESDGGQVHPLLKQEELAERHIVQRIDNLPTREVPLAAVHAQH